jgi:hypothetical protein
MEDSGVGVVGDPSDIEGLRLIKAFFRITDAERRREVVALVEKLAKQPHQHALSATSLLQDNEPSE